MVYKFLELQGETDKYTITVEDFNTMLWLQIGQEKKPSKDINDFNTINELDLMYMSSILGTFTDIDYWL